MPVSALIRNSPKRWRNVSSLISRRSLHEHDAVVLSALDFDLLGRGLWLLRHVYFQNTVVELRLDFARIHARWDRNTPHERSFPSFRPAKVVVVCVVFVLTLSPHGERTILHLD